MRETLVLIPGLNCTRALFEPQIEAFGATHEIIVANHKLDETMEGIARRLLARAPERFALAGLSMGGYIALETLRLAPGRITRLALLDTNARADTDEARANRRQLMDFAERGQFGEVHKVLWPKLVHPSRRDDAALEAVVRGMADEIGPEVFVRQETAIMSRRDSRPMLGSVQVPTLILVGDEDALTPPDQAREMAGLIPGARLAVVPDCGHLSTLERPGEVIQALQAWLR